MDKFIYYLFRIFISLFTLMPLRILYGFSDILHLFIREIMHYRRKVVNSNLKNSFPGKSNTEIKEIVRQYYRHLSDILVESLKSFSMREDDLIARYRYLNPELLDDCFKQGKSVICVAGHYGNWEWGGAASGKQLRHKPIGFYKPLSNSFIDEYVQKTRATGRTRLASITRTAETFEHDWGEPAIFFMIADQSPSSSRLAFWVNFLNQDTATLHGPEKYALLHRLPVFFAFVTKVKRGYYTVEFTLIEPDPQQTKTGEITTRFMKLLEQEIKNQPAYYLWSHRRWKLNRQKEQGEQENK